MQLVAIELSNYKSFAQRARIDGLKTVNALIGPNNQGKSSVLEAIATLWWLNGGDVAGHGNLADHMSTRLRRRSPDDTNQEFGLTVEFSLDEQDLDKLGFSRDEGLLRSIKGIKYEFAWGGDHNFRQPHSMIPTTVALCLNDESQRPLISARRSRTRRPLISYVDGGPSRVFRNHSLANADADDSIFQRPTDTNFVCLSMFKQWSDDIYWIPSYRQVSTEGSFSRYDPLNGQNLAGRLARLKQEHEPRFAEMERTLHALVPSVKRIYVTPQGNDGLVIRVAREALELSNQAERLDHVGEGIAELLYLTTAIWSARSGSKLLIEEPERGLHPGAQRTLLSMVLDHCQTHNKQVFWATHATSMAPVRGDVSCHLVAFDEEGNSAARSITPEEAQSVRTALGITPADLYSAKVVLQADGETEQAFFTEVIPYVLGPDRAAEILLKPLGGDLDSKKDPVANTFQLMMNSGTEVFVLADHDGNVDSAIAYVESHVANAISPSIRQNIHVWACGLDDSKRKPEFEDNFSSEELINAANNLAQDDQLTVRALEDRLKRKPNLKISKALSDLYYLKHEYELSKPQLGRLLAAIAIDKISANEVRGTDDGRYEFERVLEKINGLLD